MQKNSPNFSMEDIIKLANSPAGKQLMEILKQADPSALENAASQASSGDLTQAKASLAPLLSSEKVQQLLGQLGG